MTDVDSLYQMASEYLAAVTAALTGTDAGIPELKGQQVVPFVSPSLPALDCPAQVVVYVATIGTENTSPTTPITDLGHRPTTRFMTLATLVAMVTRCQPVPQGVNSAFPSGAEIEAAARRSAQDVWAVWNTVMTLKNAGTLFSARCDPLYVDNPIPVDAQGASAGWSFPVRAMIGAYTVS